MSVICGWVGANLQHERSMDLLRVMLSGEFGENSSRGDAVVLGSAAIAARASVFPASVHGVGSLLAAVSGRVQWHSADLADIAMQGGDAAAVAEAYRRHGVDC